MSLYTIHAGSACSRHCQLSSSACSRHCQLSSSACSRHCQLSSSACSRHCQLSSSACSRHCQLSSSAGSRHCQLSSSACQPNGSQQYQVRGACESGSQHALVLLLLYTTCSGILLMYVYLHFILYAILR